MCVFNKQRVTFCAGMAQPESRPNFALNGIHGSKPPPAALIIAAKSFR
jgi:hypothetical protein